ncbi:fam83h antisense RNA 1 (head to head) [Plakobranchus ocellatus]|uniref:Fam83h antisense RNA 1 (Head to head) n=1 Tax=Plakobranchus ocellatus TaxID=259542 RepID=A0AAV3YDW8_9GAST|nr:fam83h antisense RNA 1 (head to head) [Plakobranchus ocellatus]
MPPKVPPGKQAAAKAKTGTSNGPARQSVSKGKVGTAVAAKSSGTSLKKAPSNSKAGAKNEKPKQKVWTKEDDAARRIQTKYRQYIGKKALEKKRKEKEEYEELMEKLEREAFLHMVKMEQEEAERRQQKEDEERKRKKEEKKRIKRMLEAAFDGDIDQMKEIIKEVSELDDKNGIGNDVIGRAVRTKHMMSIIDCKDANENTALSEAANGGHAQAINFLLERGADPNTQGQFMRTPLYRAAFAGHLEATLALLENGADPRIYASDSQTPVDIASRDDVKAVLQDWDISRTEVLQKQLEAAKDKRAEEERKRKEAETSKLEDQVAEAQREYEAVQKQLDHAYCELNKRINEHDTCVAQGFDRPELTLQTINDQELEVETTKIRVAEARDKLSKLRLRLRESIAGEDTAVEDDSPGLKVPVKELDDVLFRDVGNRIKDSGKWPLLIDQSGQASTFLRYRDTNYINAIRPADMDNNNIRRSLLGAVRYGKPFIVDMMEVDMFDTCSDRFDEIQKDLMTSIIDKSILTIEKYGKLIKAEDGPEYEKTKFNDMRLANFKFMLISKSPFPNPKLLDMFYVIKVIIPT